MGRGLLLIVSGLVIVYGIIFASIINRQTGSDLQARTADYITYQQGKNITSSLINLALEEIEQNEDNNENWDHGWGGSFSIGGLLGADTASVLAFDQSQIGDHHFPSDTRVDEFGGWDEYMVLLYAKARYNGKWITTEALMRQEAFSEFAYFTHFENGIHFGGEDTLTGPVHSNDSVEVKDHPTFNGSFSSPYMWYGKTEHSEPIFNGPTDFNASEIPLPGPSEMLKLRDAASRIYNNKIEVKMDGDQLRISEYDPLTGVKGPEEILDKSDWDGEVIASRDTVEIMGEMNGQLTLFSNEIIEIMGDVTYSNDPQVDPTSTNLLGLVAAKEVLIDEHAHEYNGTLDIDIQASLMIPGYNGHLTVENLDQTPPDPHNPPPPIGRRGFINLYGGLIQHTRYNVQSINNDGFDKNYMYDPRLETMIPPTYPTLSTYGVIYWRDRTDYDQ